MIPLFKELTLFLLCWCVLWAPIIAYRRIWKKSYLTSPVVISILFSLSIIAFFYLGKRWFAVGLISYTEISIFTLFLLALILVFYQNSAQTFPYDHGSEKVPDHALWSVFDERYIPPKFMEIIFQQLFVSGVVTILLDYNFGLWQIVLGFALIFGLMHIPLFLFQTWQWATFYTVSAFCSALIFPMNIFLFRYGFLANITVHWLYYLISGVVYLHNRNALHHHSIHT